MPADPPLLSIESVAFRYDNRERPALDGVCLELRRGTATGLLGPNGSGKSTLISLIAGMRAPQSGRIVSNAHNAPIVAWVPQEYAFYPELTCRENLRLFAAMLPLAAAMQSARVESAAGVCQLAEFIDQRASRCSGGVRRRLNLAIALLQQPDILLLDEPTAGVDPHSRAFLLEQIRALVAKGVSVLYATHYMEEISATCSEVILLSRGRVVAAGPIAQLLAGTRVTGPFSNLEALFMHFAAERLAA